MDFIDKAISAIITPIVTFIGKVLVAIMSNNWLAIPFWIIIINIIGFVLMKKDKEYAKDEKRRVSERTLLATAAVGGSLGIYAGMYKFNHKTLHKQFTILVPMIMVAQVALITYNLFLNIV